MTFHEFSGRDVVVAIGIVCGTFVGMLGFGCLVGRLLGRCGEDYPGPRPRETYRPDVMELPLFIRRPSRQPEGSDVA